MKVVKVSGWGYLVIIITFRWEQNYFEDNFYSFCALRVINANLKI